MLIKIDHICHSCRKGKEDEVKAEFHGYHELFHQKNIINMPIKQKRCMRENRFHDIIYLEKQGSFPVEITSYENIADVESGFAFDFDRNEIRMSADYMERSIAFWELCGAKRKIETENDIMLTMRGLLDKQTLTIKIAKAKTQKTWILDGEGNVCLGLVVKNLEYEKRRIEESFEASDIKELNVNGRLLKLFFAFGLCGETVEFISI